MYKLQINQELIDFTKHQVLIKNCFDILPGTLSNPVVSISVGVSKFNFSPGVMQYSSIKPNGSTPSTGDSNIRPLTLKHPNLT